MCDNQDENRRPRPALQLLVHDEQRARDSQGLTFSLSVCRVNARRKQQRARTDLESWGLVELGIGSRGSAARAAHKCMHAAGGTPFWGPRGRMCLGEHTPRLNRGSALVGGGLTANCQWEHSPGRRCVGSDVQNQRLSRARSVGVLVVLGGSKGEEERRSGSESGCVCVVGVGVRVGLVVCGRARGRWAAGRRREGGVWLRGEWACVLLRLPVFQWDPWVWMWMWAWAQVRVRARVRWNPPRSKARKWKQAAAAAVAGTNLGGAKPTWAFDIPAQEWVCGGLNQGATAPQVSHQPSPHLHLTHFTTSC